MSPPGIDDERRAGPDEDDGHDPGDAVARRLVALFVDLHGDLPRAARAAIAHGLAGLCSRGLAGQPLDDATERVLRAGRRREAFDDAVAAREIGELCDALATEGVRPVVLKGRLLAEEVWPAPALRPAGDLDLLFSPDELRRADAALRRLGYSPAPGEGPARLRRAPTGIELSPPPPRRVAVDLHARAFRSVGHRVDAARLLSRARPASLCGRPVRALDDADRLLFLLVHAAKHGLTEPKWLVDLDLVLARADEPTLRSLARRARRTRTDRPAWAALRVLAEEARAPVPAWLLDALRPRAPWPAVLARLVTARRTAARRHAAEPYALEVALEPGLAARARLAAGVVERLMRTDVQAGGPFA